MKGLFIPGITAEMLRNGCLEAIEALMVEGEIYDIDYDFKEREPCEDTISRQAALDAVFNNAESPNKAYKAIRILPSAQSEPCDDAVSRFKVLRLIEDSSNDLSDSVDNRYIQNKVKKLPPVAPKPKMGKWLIFRWLLSVLLGVQNRAKERRNDRLLPKVRSENGGLIMTREEAARNLEYAKKWHDLPADEAIDMAISALEKQIPKKPVIGYAFTEKLREVIKRTDPERAESKTECCPVCGRTLGVSQFVKTQTGLRFGDPHCKRCGQAIEWGVSDAKI